MIIAGLNCNTRKKSSLGPNLMLALLLPGARSSLQGTILVSNVTAVKSSIIFRGAVDPEENSMQYGTQREQLLIMMHILIQMSLCCVSKSEKSTKSF